MATRIILINYQGRSILPHFIVLMKEEGKIDDDDDANKMRAFWLFLCTRRLGTL